MPLISKFSYNKTKRLEKDSRDRKPSTMSSTLAEKAVDEMKFIDDEDDDGFSFLKKWRKNTIPLNFFDGTDIPNNIHPARLNHSKDLLSKALFYDKNNNEATCSISKAQPGVDRDLLIEQSSMYFDQILDESQTKK